MAKLISVTIHMGAHKTATSHLQNSLEQHHDILADDGVRFYGPSYLRRKGKSLDRMFGLRGLWPAGGPEDAQARLEMLARGGTRVVISEENFLGPLYLPGGRISIPIYAAGPEQLESLVRSVAPNPVRLFLSVRNPATFLTSAYSQTLFGGNVLTPKAFRTMNPVEDIDWAQLVARFAAIPGIGEIYVWRYEDYRALFRTLMRRMLRWRLGSRIAPIETPVHPGLSEDAVRQVLAWHDKGQTRALAGRAREAHPISTTNPKFDLYNTAINAAATAVYDLQMEEIAALPGVTVLTPRLPAAAPSGKA